jgi:putative membrane protein
MAYPLLSIKHKEGFKMLQKKKLASCAITVALLFPATSALAASDATKERTSESSKESKSKLPSGEERFMKEAASAGLMEVELGKIAAEKGSHQRVKEFGKRMQADHSKANQQLKKIASSKGVDLPTQPSGEHKSTMDKLTKLSGAEFDREYMEAMVDDHKEDIEKFQTQADKGKDPELKKFASENLPILKKHLELAQSTEKQIKTESKGDAKSGSKSGAKSGSKEGAR